MSIKNRLFNSILSASIKISGLNKASKLSCAFAEMFGPVARISRDGNDYYFSCPNNLTRWRAGGMFTKEPETIAWVDTFSKGDKLFDIGANIGLYSIYAAKRGVDVIAFEPESQNYALLNKNVNLNRCSDRIACLNVAMAEKDSVGYLYVSVFEAGRALNSFGVIKDYNREDFIPSFRQGVVAYSLDSFLAQYRGAFPDHIKIDVDGLEPEIIKGAESTLRDVRVKSVLVEFNEKLTEHMEAAGFLRSAGFTLLKKTCLGTPGDRKYETCFNYIYVR